MSSENVRPDLRSAHRCFIDVETTGAIFGYHEIIEVGAVRTSADAQDILGQWTRRIRPRHPERITDRAREVNGFTPEAWQTAEAPSPSLWASFVEFARDAVPVCHNPSFDRAFITLAAGEFQITDLGLDYHWIGTESLAWPLLLQGCIREFSLDALCEHFKVSIEPRPHTGLDGAKACLAVYRAVLAQLLG